MTTRRPPPLIHASIGLHVFAAGAVTMQPSWWPMALATLVADHAAITAAGLWPRSDWLGPNLTRLSPPAMARREIALTIDDGPDPEVTPRVLDLLDVHAMRATFFCVGTRVAEHATLAREIVARGHAVENHSHRHRHDFSLLGPRALDRELDAAQRAITDATGVAPQWFRAPAGLRNVFLQGALDRAGLALASWTRRGFDTVRGEADRVVDSLTRGLTPGDILLVHDGHAARDASGTPVVLAVLPRLAVRFAAERLTPVTLAAARRTDPA